MFNLYEVLINHIVGAIFEEDIKDLLYSPYGISLAQHDKTNEKFKLYIKDIISAEISWGVDKILEIYNMYSDTSKGLFITKNNQYYGFINLKNLLELSYSRNIEIASDQNPLTKLAGNKSIEKYLDNVFINKHENDYFIVYFDFNDFKPFNDTYGFRQGDRAILLFSEILKNYIDSVDFIAHIGGDDFFVAFSNKLYKDVFIIINSIQTLFKQEVKKFYTKKDRKNEFLRIKDRFGVKRKFKLLEVSSAIINITSKTKQENFDLILGSVKKASKVINIPLGISII